MFPTSVGTKLAAKAPKPLDIPANDGEGVIDAVSVAVSEAVIGAAMAVVTAAREKISTEDVEPSVTPPTRSPGHRQASDISEPSPPDSDDKDGNAKATEATAATLASPTFTIPTPRGVEQMSPGIVQEPKGQPPLPRIVVDGKTTVQCCFCGRNSQGSAAMKRHVYASCQAKPKVADKTQIDAIIEEYLVKNYTSTPSVEKTRQRVDPDETEEDSDSDDVGRRSDEARVKQKNATAAFLNDDDEEQDVRVDMTQRIARAARDDVEEEQPAPPATETVTMPSKRERRPSAKLASTVNKSKSVVEAEKTRMNKTTSLVTNASTLTCEKCGVFTALKPVGLKIHMTKCKASVPASSIQKLASEAMVQKKTHAGALTQIKTTRKRRKCLLSDENECTHVCRNAAELVSHMREHGIEVVFGSNANTVVDDVDEVQVPEAVARGQTPPTTTATTIVVHWAARKCTMCSHEKFASRQELCAHYMDEHGCAAEDIAKTTVGVESSKKRRVPSPTRPQREKRATSRYARESVSPPPTKSPLPAAQALPSMKLLIGAERNCEYCSFHTGSFRMLKTHYMKEHGVEVEVSESAPEPAPEPVPQKVQKVAAPQRETVVKPGDEVCACHCGRGFPSARSLKAHMRWCKSKPAAVAAVSSGAVTDVDDEWQQTVCEEIGSDGDDVSQPSETSWTILKTETTCPQCRSAFNSHEVLIRHMHKEHGIKNLTVVDAMRQSEVPEVSKKRGRPPTSALHDALPSTKRIPTRHNVNDDRLAIIPVSTELVTSHLASGETVSAGVVNKLMAKLEEQNARISALERTCDAMKTLVDPFNAGAKIQRIHVDDQSSSSGFTPITTFGRLVWLTNVCAANLELPVEGQMREALEYLVQLLDRAGTDVLHLISIKIYLSDNRDMGPIVKVWDDFFTKLGVAPNNRPVRNTVISHGFSKHRLMKVELHGHAVLPGPNENALAKSIP